MASYQYSGEVVTISVERSHIREAESLAADNSGRRNVVSPVLRALREQSRFVSGVFTTRGITLHDTFKRERVHYQPHAELRAYVVAWSQGEAIEPARFTLNPAL